MAGSITNWPGVTPLAARAVGVTVTSASTTRMVFIEAQLPAGDAAGTARTMNRCGAAPT